MSALHGFIQHIWSLAVQQNGIEVEKPHCKS